MRNALNLTMDYLMEKAKKGEGEILNLIMFIRHSIPNTPGGESVRDHKGIEGDKALPDQGGGPIAGKHREES